MITGSVFHIFRFSIDTNQPSSNILGSFFNPKPIRGITKSVSRQQAEHETILFLKITQCSAFYTQ